MKSDKIYMIQLFIASSHPHMGATKLYAHITGALAPPYPSGWWGGELWYQMALVDTTVEQSLVSSAGGARGRKCVYCV